MTKTGRATALQQRTDVRKPQDARKGRALETKATVLAEEAARRSAENCVPAVEDSYAVCTMDVSSNPSPLLDTPTHMPDVWTRAVLGTSKMPGGRKCIVET